MITEAELVALIETLEADMLHDWIARDWVRPQQRLPAFGFDATDVARVRFICELRHELSIDEENLPVVISLVDQLYGLRRIVRAFTTAVEAQPPDVRAGIVAQVRTALRHEDNDF